MKAADMQCWDIAVQVLWFTMQQSSWLCYFFMNKQLVLKYETNVIRNIKGKCYWLYLIHTDKMEWSPYNVPLLFSTGWWWHKLVLFELCENFETGGLKMSKELLVVVVILASILTARTCCRMCLGNWVSFLTWLSLYNNMLTHLLTCDATFSAFFQCL